MVMSHMGESPVSLADLRRAASLSNGSAVAVIQELCRVLVEPVATLSRSLAPQGVVIDKAGSVRVTANPRAVVNQWFGALASCCR